VRKIRPGRENGAQPNQKTKRIIVFLRTALKWD
jgi:hypothetical protein